MLAPTAANAVTRSLRAAPLSRAGGPASQHRAVRAVCAAAMAQAKVEVS